MQDRNSLLLDAIAFEPESKKLTAWAGHIPYAHYLIRVLKPKVFAELGTHHGGSYFAICQTIKANGLKTKAFAIDTWQGEAHAGRYDESVYTAVAEENKKYTGFSTLVRSTFDSALDSFENGSIDLLHIDGFHTYEAVRHDFETWLVKLAPGATVLFHDTFERGRDFGVYKFWEELMQKYDGFEFYHSHGLGVLQLPGAKVKLIPSQAELAKFRHIFETAGASMSQSNYEAVYGIDPISHAKKLATRVRLLEASTSWKITAPLRAFTRLFKKNK